jgi:hypothetical protein
MLELLDVQVVINDCHIAVGVENPHKFSICRESRIPGGATYRRYYSHSCYYEACGHFAAHSTSPTPTVMGPPWMGHSFIVTLY